VPHQGATNDCAIYSLLFAHAIHHNLTVSTTHFRIDGRRGRRHVAHCILTGHLRGHNLNRHLDTGRLSEGQTEHADVLPQNYTTDLTGRDGQTLRTTTATNDTIGPSISKESHSTNTDTIHKAQRQFGPPPDRVGDYSTEPNWDKLELKEWEEAGLGLFTKARMTRNTLIGMLTGTTGSTLDKQDTSQVLD